MDAVSLFNFDENLFLFKFESFICRPISHSVVENICI